MNQVISKSFPYSIFFLMDPSFGEIPEKMGRSTCLVTNSCVALGTLSESDGETTIEISGSDHIPKDYIRVFHGRIETGQNGLCVCDAFLNTHLSLGGINQVIEVFSNELAEPNHFLICLKPV